MCVLSCFSRIRLFATLWTVAHQAPLSMGFSRQEYGSGLPCPLSGDLPDPGIEPVPFMSPAVQVDSLPLIHQESLWLLLRVEFFTDFQVFIPFLFNRHSLCIDYILNLHTKSVNFFFFLATPRGMWDLNPLTRDRTHIPCSGSLEP